ncbi:MAG: hypothetical protein ACOCY7_01305 [Halodesulfurarchaeum sp.]
MTQSVPRWQVLSTTIIVVISAVSSLLGLFWSDHYSESAELVTRLQAQDAVILAIGVPVLSIGLVRARRGSVRGTLVWLGSLAFTTYMWASYALTVPFDAFFLGYLLLFGLSLFTLLGGILNLDVDAVSNALDGRVSRRIYAGFLGFAAIGLAALWFSEIVVAVLAGTDPAVIEAFGPQAVGTYIIDLGVVVPSLAIAAGWLWQRRPWGYAVTGVLLVFAGLLAPAITAITVVDVQQGLSLSTASIVASIVPPLVGAVFAGTYLRAATPIRSA